MKYEEIKLYNPGILCGEMPNETFMELASSCEKQLASKSINNALKRNMVTDHTVQGIGEALQMSIPKSYDDFLCNFAQEFSSKFELPVENLKPKVIQQWLNLQKKYEYRPLHCHNDGSGKGLSFVTYIKIPYNLKDEDSFGNHTKKAVIFRNGRLEFMYLNYSGKPITHTVNIDSSFEGKTLMFSNSMHHIVYPFYTSDEYRISLAGNIIFQ